MLCIDQQNELDRLVDGHVQAEVAGDVGGYGQQRGTGQFGDAYLATPPVLSPVTSTTRTTCPDPRDRSRQRGQGNHLSFEELVQPCGVGPVLGLPVLRQRAVDRPAVGAVVRLCPPAVEDREL